MIPEELTDVPRATFFARLTVAIAQRQAAFNAIDDPDNTIKNALKLKDDENDPELLAACHAMALGYALAGDYTTGSLVSALTELCRGTPAGDWDALALLDEHDLRPQSHAVQRAQKATRRAAHLVALCPAE